MAEAEVSADLNLPEVVGPFLGAGILTSSSLSNSSSVIANAEVCAVLAQCSTRIRTCSYLLRSMEALEAAVGFPPALVPGWAEMVAACEALPWERWST